MEIRYTGRFMEIRHTERLTVVLRGASMTSNFEIGQRILVWLLDTRG